MGDATTPDPLDRSRMTFGEHLDELRTRLIRSLLATLVTTVVASCFASELMEVIVAPYQSAMRALHADPTLKVAGVTETFVTYFKIGLIVGLATAAPVWLYQLWAFIAAGLYDREKRWVYRFAPLSLFLFIAGTVFGYLTLLPVGLGYLLRFADPAIIQSWIQLGEYLSFFSTLTLLVGVAFQFPVVMIGLVKAGIFTPETFRKKRRITILIIFVVSGVITPPDPITQSLVALPLCFLFEMGILLCWLAQGQDRPPVRWDLWRKRARIIAGVLIVLILLRSRLERFWAGMQADRRVEMATDGNLPWRELGRNVFGVRADGAMQVGEAVNSPLMLITAGDRLACLQFNPSDEKAVAVEVRSGGYRAMSIQAGATVWDISTPANLPLSQTLRAVLTALESGGSDTRAFARRVFEILMHTRLPDDRDAALKAAQDWVGVHGAESFIQPDTAGDSRRSPR